MTDKDKLRKGTTLSDSNNAKRSQDESHDQDNDGYTVVRNRRKDKKIVGSRKSPSTLKSAVKNVDLYIGNCGLEVTTDDLSNYISEQASVNVNACEQLVSKYDHYISFKITLNIKDRAGLLEPEFWPEGIVCRKFYNPRKSSTSK